MQHKYHIHITISSIMLILAALNLTSCTRELNHIERVKLSGELTVLTRNSGTTFYERGFWPTGVEFDLVKGFAEELGVRINFVIADNVKDLLQRLNDDSVDFAAAGLTITEKRKGALLFTPPYQKVSQQLIYKRGQKRPKSLPSLTGHLEVVADSSHAERLKRLHHTIDGLQWSENNELESDDLLLRVASGELDYTISDSNEFILTRRFMPELRVAFNIGEPDQLAWAFTNRGDQSLYNAAVEYMTRMNNSGQTTKILSRHYGHLDRYNYVGTRTYIRDINNRLPKYLNLFKEAGNETGLDWRLLASLAYQESHWKPGAVSPTGVRGIMMLTNNTARHMGVKDRTDPSESILGGARYFKKLFTKIPKRIAQPDRAWFALAAYNIGLGHVEDTRIITQKLNKNHDSWKAVKENLPKLQQIRWYKKTKYGYARGNEAKVYVENIRSYYDILVWHTEQQQLKEAKLEALNRPPALNIEAPSL